MPSTYPEYIETFIQTVVKASTQFDLITLAFSDWGFRDFTVNWIAAMELSNVSNYLVIALDEDIYQYLSDRKVPVVPLFLGNSGKNSEKAWLESLWLLRLTVFSELSARKINFIHSDVDAVWLRSPMEFFKANEHYDMLFSSGTNFPLETSRKMGFVACCGLFSVVGNKNTAGFFRAVTDYSMNYFDDQVCLNSLLSDDDFSWTLSRGIYHLHKQSHFLDESDDGKFLCSREIITGISETRNLTVGILPHHLFQRIPQIGNDAFVKHILAPRDLSQRLDILVKNGCWLLKDNWQDLSFDRSNICQKLVN